MGIGPDSAAFLAASAASGVSFDRTVMLGRQELFAGRRALDAILADFGRPPMSGTSDYAEPFFEALGATTVDALDASDYQGASIVHDLCRPVPDTLRERFSVVLDGGTLEHVFDFPTALRSCTELVAPGGHLLLVTPANNYMGHGFYQFSPELFFSALGPGSGFEVEWLLLRESGRFARWRLLTDPRTLGSRVSPATHRPAQLFVRARRTGDVTPFVPQQSDYETTWSGARSRGRALLDGLPPAVRRAVSSVVVPVRSRLTAERATTRVDLRELAGVSR